MSVNSLISKMNYEPRSHSESSLQMISLGKFCGSGSLAIVFGDYIWVLFYCSIGRFQKTYPNYALRTNNGKHTQTPTSNKGNATANWESHWARRYRILLLALSLRGAGCIFCSYLFIFLKFIFLILFPILPHSLIV